MIQLVGHQKSVQQVILSAQVLPNRLINKIAQTAPIPAPIPVYKAFSNVAKLSKYNEISRPQLIETKTIKMRWVIFIYLILLRWAGIATQ
jgi:hypothetical protein